MLLSCENFLLSQERRPPTFRCLVMNCEERLSEASGTFHLEIRFGHAKTCLRLSILGQPGPFFSGRICAGSSIFHHTRSEGETKVRLFAILPDRAFDFFGLSEQLSIFLHKKLLAVGSFMK
jgi:hypothetical protein